MESKENTNNSNQELEKIQDKVQLRTIWIAWKSIWFNKKVFYLYNSKMKNRDY